MGLCSLQCLISMGLAMSRVKVEWILRSTGLVRGALYLIEPCAQECARTVSRRGRSGNGFLLSYGFSHSRPFLFVKRFLVEALTPIKEGDFSFKVS